MLQVSVYILLILCSVYLLQSHAEIERRHTQLKSPLERVFIRRKRALLFPPGSFVKFTCALGKGLLSTYPRGVSFNLEEAVYWPLPGATADLYSKGYLSKSTTAKPQSSTAATYVYIPGTDWRFKAQAHLKSQPQRIDVSTSSYAKPYKWQKWVKHGAQYDRRPWQSETQFKWSKWTTPAPKWRDWAQRWQVEHKRIYRSIEKEPKRLHYRGHRDRRHLFDHFNGFSNLFGIDMKSCIMRTICDSKRLLLPPGYSMLQDMLRVVFTMPTISGLDDEFSRNMRKDSTACALELKSKCNMNLIIWLLSGGIK